MARQYYLGALLFIVASLGMVYGQTGGFQFTSYDDSLHLYQNQLLNPATLDSIKEFWAVPFHKRTQATVRATPPVWEVLYAPLTFTVWAGLSHVARFEHAVVSPMGTPTTLNPAVFHVANLLVHTLASLAVLALLLRLLEAVNPDSGKRWQIFAALVGAALFALHPYQTESVAWSTQLNTLLSTWLGVLSLICYLQCAQDAENPGGGARFYWLASALFLLALLAKPTILLLPVLAFILAEVAYGNVWRWQLRRLGPWLICSAAWALLVSSSQAATPAAAQVPWWQRPILVGDSVAFYMGHFITAWNLCPDYNRPPHWVLAQQQSYLVWIFPVAWLVAAWLLRHKLPLLFAGTLFFIICVLPASGLVPTYFHYRSVVADRYVYVALIGVAVAAAGLLCRYRPATRQGQALVALGAILVLVFWGALSTRQAGYWSEDATLYSLKEGMHANPRTWWALQSLGNIAMMHGQPDEGLRYYYMAIFINPTRPDLYFSLANAWRTLNKPDHALSAIRQALLLQPDNAPALDIEAQILLGQKQPEKAVALWRQAVILDPGFTRAYVNLGATLAQMGLHAQAVTALQKAVSQDPGNATLRYYLGLSLQKLGRQKEAQAQWQEALRLAPGDARVQAALSAH